MLKGPFKRPICILHYHHLYDNNQILDLKPQFQNVITAFVRLQYQIKNTDMTTMMSIGGPLMLVTQLLIIPFLR